MKIALERAIGQNNSPRVAEIDEQLEAMQKELVKKANANQGVEALADKIETLREEKKRHLLEDADRAGIDTLREEKQSLLLEDANQAGLKKRIDELETFLEEQSTEVEDYDEAMVRQLIRKITVFDDRLVFEFKSGIETEVQM